MLKEPLSRKNRNTLNMMMAAIYALGDPQHHQLSYRSHAEAFLARFDREDRIRYEFERVYKTNKKNLQVLIDELLIEETYFKDWLGKFRELIHENKPMITNEQIVLPEAESFMKIVQDNNWDSGYEGQISAFHAHLNSIPKYDRIKKTTDFQLKRLVLNFLYLSIAQIGIKPVDKFSMCYSISRFFEEKLGKNWRQQLDDESRFANTY